MAETHDIPRAPRGLGAAGKRWWTEIMAVYDFTGAPDVLLLAEDTARTVDIVAHLQSVVDRACRDDALRTKGSRNQDVAIPECDLLVKFRAQQAALLKQLDLPGDDSDEPGRVMTRSELGVKAAAARWGRRYG
jgi:hypothetical protein